MGFSDTSLIVKALQASKGNVPLAVDYLVAAGSAIDKPQQKTSKPGLSSEEEMALSQFRNMGFTDEVNNLRILRQCHGKMNEAITILVTQQQQQQQQQRQQQPTVVEQKVAKSPMDELLFLSEQPSQQSSNLFGQHPIQSNPVVNNSTNRPNPFTLQTESTQGGFSKDAILSLYDSAPKRPTNNPFMASQSVQSTNNPFASMSSQPFNSMNTSQQFSSINSQQFSPTSNNQQFSPNQQFNTMNSGISGSQFTSQPTGKQQPLSQFNNQQSTGQFQSNQFNNQQFGQFTSQQQPANHNASFASSFASQQSLGQSQQSAASDPFNILQQSNPFKPRNQTAATNLPMANSNNQVNSNNSNFTNEFMSGFEVKNTKQVQSSDPFESLI